ncbi:MAG TPA: hypothetical protein VGO47_04250, partial [Chlamydiales bacterium]|nr:hypothetical protein [Chlamydiales bacterium]
MNVESLALATRPLGGRVRVLHAVSSRSWRWVPHAVAPPRVGWPRTADVEVRGGALRLSVAWLLWLWCPAR